MIHFSAENNFSADLCFMKGINMDKREKWQERFGWYWYGGYEVVNDCTDKFEEDARRYRENGITTVILFGTHFRYSFWKYWRDIEKMIGKIVEAFHNEGLKVIEHHSSHLTYKPLKEEDWKVLLKKGSYGKHGDFIDFKESSQANPVLFGAHLDDFAQIDGSTGKPCLSSYIHTEGKDMEWIFKHYNGNAHCFNHPSFEASYKDHLKRIIETGIDGIMNDDVQWFGGSNACACEYCSKKFKDETGYSLPSKEEWKDFYENYSDKRYIVWKRFKKKSSADFHRRLDEFYKELGFHPIRPAYCAEVLPFDTTCYGFEGAADLWDYIFQECYGIIKNSYICFAAEAVHRYALAKRYDVPSMALLYPSTKDSTYAGWALCRSWGQLFTAANGGVNVLYDKEYRAFEKKYSDFYFDPNKMADVSFYFSKKTRDLSDRNAPQKYMKPLMSYIESAYVSQICCDMVFEEDDIELLKTHKKIALISVAVLSDEELIKLSEYVKSGGTLFICGDFGIKDENLDERDVNDALSIIGLKSIVKSQKREKLKVNLSYKNKNVFLDESTVYGTIESKNAQSLTPDSDTYAVIEKVGEGEIIFFFGETSSNPIQPAIWPKADPRGTFADRSYVSDMKRGNGSALELLVGRQIIIENNENIVSSIYSVANGYALHLVNTKDMIGNEDSFVFSGDPIAQFSDINSDQEKIGKTTIRVENKLINGFKTISCASPEFKGEKELIYSVKENETVLTVPEGLFSGYLLIMFKK